MKTNFRVVVILLMLIVSMGFVYQEAQAASIQINVIVSPESPQPVGSCFDVTIQASGNFRAARVRFENNGWYESPNISFSQRFCTDNMAPGTYHIFVEVAYRNDNKWSFPIQVQLPYILSERQDNFTLSVSPERLGPGEIVTVSWKNSAPSNNDWVSMHEVNAPNSQFITWQRIFGTEGNLFFIVPMNSGQFVFRMFRNGAQVAQSNVFTVVMKQPAKCPWCQEQNGGVHVTFVCQYWNRGAVTHDPPNALEWTCGDGKGVDFNLACLDAYGSDRQFATLEHWWDKFNWRCSSQPGKVDHP